MTSPQKPKPEFETIPTELSRLGYTCLGTAELTQESSWSRAPNLKIWARTVKMVQSYDFFRGKRINSTLRTPDGHLGPGRKSRVQAYDTRGSRSVGWVLDHARHEYEDVYSDPILS